MITAIVVCATLFVIAALIGWFACRRSGQISQQEYQQEFEQSVKRCAEGMR